MNKYEQLLRDQAGPLLAPGETLEAIGLLVTGFWKYKYFLAAATQQRLILVEVESTLFGPRAVHKTTRDLPFRSMASLEGARLFNPGVRIAMHSGESLRLQVLQTLRIPFSYMPFVSRLRALYRAHHEGAGLAPPSAAPFAAPSSVSALERLRAANERTPSLLRGLIAGAVVAALAAALWALITVVTSFQISWMAIGLGLLVGGAVRLFGGRSGLIDGLAAAALSFAGCALGNLLWVTYFVSQDGKWTFLEALVYVLTHPDAALELMTLAFDVIDLLFYVVAAYVGFRMAYGGRARPAQAPWEPGA